MVLDDGTLGGDADVLLIDFNTVRRVGQELGLELNEQKCELITDDDDVVDKFRADAPSILHIKTSQAVLLGAPIGSTEEIDSTLSRKVAEFQRLTSRLKQLNAHDAFFLLKNCFSLPKLQYVLRCAPCFNSQVLHRYDNMIIS